MNNNTSKRKSKARDIHLQFVNHCALIVQTHWRGYLQRKRYRQFLPIYRRFRQLMLGAYQGWKIRRIMKLQHIRQEVQKVQERAKHHQSNMGRIAKRQLTDQIERLRRRGRWVDMYRKEKIMKSSTRKELTKQNASLYGNIKSKSIRNIFHQTIPHKQQRKCEIQAKSSAILNKKEETLSSTNKKQKASDFDEIKLKKPKDFYELLEQKLEGRECQELNQKRKESNVKRPIKKAQARQKKQQVKVIQPEQIPHYPTGPAKIVQEASKSSENKNEAVSGESLSCNSNIPRSQKLKITLSKRQSQCSQMSSSTASLLESNIQIKLIQLDSKSINMSTSLNQILKHYSSSYFQKKQTLKNKIEVTYRGCTIKNEMKQFLDDKY